MPSDVLAWAGFLTPGHPRKGFMGIVGNLRCSGRVEKRQLVVSEPQRKLAQGRKTEQEVDKRANHQIIFWMAPQLVVGKQPNELILR